MNERYVKKRDVYDRFKSRIQLKLICIVRSFDTIHSKEIAMSNVHAE